MRVEKGSQLDGTDTRDTREEENFPQMEGLHSASGRGVVSGARGVTCHSINRNLATTSGGRQQGRQSSPERYCLSSSKAG